MSLSNIAGRKGSTTDCPRWQPNWFAAKLRSSLRLAGVRYQDWQPERRQTKSRSYSPLEIDQAFAAIIQQKADALIVGTDPFLLGQRDQLVRLATRHVVPTIYFTREFVDAGGLISYGPNIANGYRQAGTYVGRILNGERPGELPVLQPTHFVLFINLKTAKAFGMNCLQRCSRSPTR
jgi:hypothetical protein